MKPLDTFAPACPLPIVDKERIHMAHGGGGRIMQEIIENVFLPNLGSPWLETRHDGALLQMGGARLAFTTDSYVVQPLFFPGGDIGSLAVNGTVNDLAMCGARPQYLSCGFILEEGLPRETLERVVHSMKAAAERAGVHFVTGDTKVVDKGKGDGLFINTAGIGIIEHNGPAIGPASVRPGDVLLLSGDIARHGLAIMALREGLEFESTIMSDCAPVADIVLALLSAGIEVHCLRDLTRGGLASCLVEIARDGGHHLRIAETAVPVDEGVRGACEILGLDPLYVANEGRFLAVVPQDQAERALQIMRAHPEAHNACAIGTVLNENDGRVTLTTSVGTTRLVDLLSGEQLPRIC